MQMRRALGGAVRAIRVSGMRLIRGWGLGWVKRGRRRNGPWVAGARGGVWGMQHQGAGGLAASCQEPHKSTYRTGHRRHPAWEVSGRLAESTANPREPKKPKVPLQLLTWSPPHTRADMTCTYDVCSEIRTLHCYTWLHTRGWAPHGPNAVQGRPRPPGTGDPPS